MGGPTLNTEDFMWDMAKGHISLGGLNMMWDFTEGLSKEAWLHKRKVENQDRYSMFILKNGRVIMPLLEIY